MVGRPRPGKVEPEPVRLVLANDRRERFLKRSERTASHEKESVEDGDARCVLPTFRRKRLAHSLESERRQRLERFASNVRRDSLELVPLLRFQLALKQISLPGCRAAGLALERLHRGTQATHVLRKDIIDPEDAEAIFLADAHALERRARLWGTLAQHLAHARLVVEERENRQRDYWPAIASPRHHGIVRRGARSHPSHFFRQQLHP